MKYHIGAVYVGGVQLPRLKKGIDDIDLKLLTALYYLREGTAFDLSNLTGITRGTASKRLRDLTEVGILREPEIDISTGKLRKVYKTPDKRIIENLLFEWWKRDYEEFGDMIGEELEEPSEKVFKEELKEKIEWGFTVEDLKKLIDGVTLDELLKDSRNKDVDTIVIFEQELVGNLEVKNGVVKLTEEGFKNFTTTIKKDIKENIKDGFEKLREISVDAARKFLEELKTEIEKLEAELTW
ncbi:hypothetical protein DRP07_12020 [Archaeoglobales archaeon]|nr:MAG: hypothetical protein DRP07_12020 [Archaeoglobales archaeon]